MEVGGRSEVLLIMESSAPYPDHFDATIVPFGEAIARELMGRDLVSAAPGEKLDNVLHRMMEFELEAMPVIDDTHKIIVQY
ncbi:hypothetical protein Ga0074115_10661 [endosymbiont of Ridgeia piscesae]|jgi:CBS-domain-containing membrane protein|uniref:CBS domain-containing protein n=1 Tax=endosymbiont of Ridgeia piscesae TaxID=54398 RepID=A0A0T5Z1U0_9GAMM|nr:hypothetical protein Ga0074115_10661 [endosymbiont of Ridgeia piscesae]KRT56749.1 hypothetical protein Ga0076813_10207 [endosymbiont of Ridgeia piscesae]